MDNSRNRSGYTLLELLIVIGLVGILIFAISLPQIGSFIDAFNLQLCVHQTRQHILTAQRLAIARQTTVYLKCVPRTLLFPAQILLIQGTSVSKRFFSGGITFSGHLVFSFSDSGFVLPGGSGTLIISNHRNQMKKLIVSSLGAVRIE
jgi:prepilin-type N-terminal cleavage/methylation domain-containing protein